MCRRGAAWAEPRSLDGTTWCVCTHCWCFPEERVPCLVADDEHLGETSVMLPVSTVSAATPHSACSNCTHCRGFPEVRMLCLVADAEPRGDPGNASSQHWVGEWKARPACVPGDLHEIRRVLWLVWRRASVRAEPLVPPLPQIGLRDATEQKLLRGLFA